MADVGKLFEEALSVFNVVDKAASKVSKPAKPAASSVPNPFGGIATTMPPKPAGGELTAAREAGPAEPVPRKVRMEPFEGQNYSAKPTPKGGELSAARLEARKGRRQPISRAAEREAAEPAAPATPALGGPTTAERVVNPELPKREQAPVKSLFRDIEKHPGARWRPMSGGRIYADAAKGDLNIYNIDQRKGKPVDYLRALEDEAQSRGLGGVRVTGAAAKRMEDVLKNSNYAQEGTAWVKKLAVAGAAAGGAAVAGTDQADAAGFKSPWGFSSYEGVSAAQHASNLKTRIGQLSRDMTDFNKRYPGEAHPGRQELVKLRQELRELEKGGGKGAALATGGAAAAGATAAGTNEADAADLKAIAKMFDTLEKSTKRLWFETPEGRMFAEVVDIPEEGGKFFNVTSAMTAPKKRGSGEFINNFFAVEAEAKARGYAGIKAELVINPKLSEFLKRSGYVQDVDAELGAPLKGLDVGNYTKKFGAAGAAGAGAAALTGDDAEAQGAGYTVELPDGKVVTFPPGTSMEQVQETVDRYKEETKTGFGRTKELFHEGVDTLKRGGEQLTGKVAPEPMGEQHGMDKVYEFMDSAARRFGITPPYRDQGPPTEEQQKKGEYAYQKAAGVGNLISGVFDLVTSPAGMVSQPLSKVDIAGTHIHPRATEAVLSLFSPAAAVKAAKAVPWTAMGTATKSAIVNTAAKLPKLGIGPNADKDMAKALIREKGGTAARETATTLENFEQYRRQVNAMPDHERLDLYRYIEGRSVGQNITNPAHQALADTIKAEFMKRRTVLSNMTTTQRMAFIEDYFPHMWTDPRAAAQNMRAAAKQGSGKNLRKRDIPTISDGLAQGLTLKTTDPIEATMAYVSNMDRFIASTKVVEEARALGKVKYYLRGDRRIPAGWEPLEGRLSTKATPAPGVNMIAHAPKEFATTYNNFISKGFYQWERPGQIYDAALKTSNAVTALELGLSGFHAVTMANESALSSIANGLRRIVGGAATLSPRQVLGGVKDIAKAPLAPITTAWRGGQLKNVYLGQTAGTAHMQKIVELLEHAGGRAAGFSHAPDYKFSSAHSYWTSWKRGALRAELAADAAAIKASPVLGTGKTVIKHVGRFMTTVAQPLFEKYIPALKNGAFYEHMTAWLKLNPSATQTQQLVEARKIWDSMDNRFGEMVQDNIFWNKLFKQSAMLAMRSYSWNMGTVREIGGGVVDLARAAKNREFTTRAAYAIALPIYVAMMNATYQYMKTGKAPESVDDLMAGQTGGEAPGVRVPSLPRSRGMPNVPTGRQAQVPERAMIPGYQKDVFGWYEDWQQELKNKVATAPRMAGELATNKDWKNDPIFNPEASAPEWLVQMFEYIGQNMGPISIRQMLRGEKTGSNISTPEMLGGIRPAPGYLQDPEGHAEAKRRRNNQAQSRKKFLEQRQQRQYQGSQE